MSPYRCLLITLSNGAYLLRCALKIHVDRVKDDVLRNPLEPENKEILMTFLPLHVREHGDIVEVDEIFEIAEKVGL